MADLHNRLLAAHAAGDKLELMRLYTEAADVAPNADAEGFFLTHAYVHALEAGSPSARTLHKRLKDKGREE